MNKLSFSLLLALFLTAFSTNAAAQNQVFEIVNTANIYKKTNSFRGDFALVGTSNREGVIDKNGRELIPCHHIPYAISSPLTLFDEERLAVENRDNNLHGYYDTEGNVAIPFIYKRSGSFEGGHVPVERENGKWGVIDKNGNTVVPFKYDFISGFTDDGLAVAGKRKGDSSLSLLKGMIDINGKEIIPLIYEEVERISDGFARVEDSDGNYSFFDKNGKKVFFLGEKFAWASSFSEGYAAVRERGTKKYGFIDKTGKLIAPCIYDSYEVFGSFEGGVAIVKKGEHWGLIDLKKRGAVIAPFSYEWISHHWNKKGWTVARKAGKFGVLDISGKEILPCSYQGAEVWGDGLIAIKRDGKFGFFDEKGKQITPYEYDKTDPFWSGFAVVTKDGKEGLVDMSGRLVIPCSYEWISYQAAFDLVIFKENGRYGFFDSKGTMVIPPIFLECTHFNQDGLALTDRYVLSIKNKPAQHMSYIEASEKGYADAQFFRAIYCFRKGENEEGRKWLDKAVQQGLAVAQHMMGSIYRNGWYGVEKNKGLAFLNESMAAQKGNIPAQMELGLAYGLADQYKDAVEWLRKAAESGNSEAHIYLGMCYEEGLGVERDYNEALKLYDWSFERDHNKTASEAYRRVIEKMKQ